MSFIKRFRASLESLYSLPENADYVIAYSGGVDSHVLLSCCRQLRLPVRAVHVHHGLQSVADEWVEHCRRVCVALDVRLDVLYVEVEKKRGQSPEEAARNARYQALQGNLCSDEVLLTAQHLNDQAETFLLQLFRTANSAGLSAMPSCRKFGGHVHLRPLLSFGREEIEQYARGQGLHWIEDPSNEDTGFDRNFIRKKLVPLLAGRWPNITQQLSTVASMQSRNMQVLEDMAAIDLANTIIAPQGRIEIGYHIVSMLSLAGLMQLSAARQLNLLRYWLIQASGTGALSGQKILPGRKLLEEIIRSLVHARDDASPVIACAGCELRKYRDVLYLLAPDKLESGIKDLARKIIPWNPSQLLEMPLLDLYLSVTSTPGEGLKTELLKGPLSVRFRQGGECFHPVGRQHSQSLKKLLQEANIPPWQRGSIPLLYCKDELIAVIGLWISRQHTANENEQGWVVDIKKAR